MGNARATRAHAHAIGAALQAKGLGAGLVVDVIDQMHMDQHIVTHRFRRGGVACTARQKQHKRQYLQAGRHVKAVQ